MPDQLEKGSKLGQYEVRELLGRGGMASVFRAYQAVLDREVALKVISDKYAADPAYVERFRQEARSIARLRHPNIVTVFDAGNEAGLLYIVMELIEGPTLKEQQGGRSLPLARISQVLEQLASSLDYAHSRKIIHRDVKPSNVLLDNEGRPILSDFGIARLIETPGHLTASGKGVGTPSYMSPEQASGEDMDGRSDQYSLGVMVYEMVTGRLPFTGETPVVIAMGHLNKPLPSVRQFNPAVTPGLEKVIFKALSKNPGDRFENCSAFSRAFNFELDLSSKPPSEGPTLSINPGTGAKLPPSILPSNSSFDLSAQGQFNSPPSPPEIQISNAPTTPLPFTPPPLSSRGTPVQTGGKSGPVLTLPAQGINSKPRKAIVSGGVVLLLLLGLIGAAVLVWNKPAGSPTGNNSAGPLLDDNSNFEIVREPFQQDQLLIPYYSLRKLTSGGSGVYFLLRSSADEPLSVSVTAIFKDSNGNELDRVRTNLGLQIIGSKNTAPFSASSLKARNVRKVSWEIQSRPLRLDPAAQLFYPDSNFKAQDYRIREGNPNTLLGNFINNGPGEVYNLRVLAVVFGPDKTALLVLEGKSKDNLLGSGATSAYQVELPAFPGEVGLNQLSFDIYFEGTRKA